MEISITLKTYVTKHQSLSKNLCNFHIDQIKERLVKHPLKMLGIVQKKLYRTTLKKNTIKEERITATLNSY